MNHKNKIRTILRAVCLLCCLSVMQFTAVFANAAEVTEDNSMGVSLGQSVDVNKTGSITVKEKHGSGITYKIYQIAEFDSRGSAYYSDAFAAYKNEVTVSPSAVVSSEDAEALVHNFTDIIANHGIEANAAAVTDSNGNVLFSGLTPGYYYVMAESFTTEDGKVYSASPVFISLPGSNEAGVYNITVESKSEMKTPTVPENPPKEDKPKEDKPTGNLPQTGVLWWPVPVLFAAGLIFYFLGYITELRRSKFEQED